MNCLFASWVQEGGGLSTMLRIIVCDDVILFSYSAILNTFMSYHK
jgi:hypothetical protein